MPANEFVTWQPPEEEGDDEPLLGPRAKDTEKSAGRSEGEPRPSDVRGEPLAPDMAELFLSVGRRDGVRAQELLQQLVDVAGLDPATVQRIRVRERHSFVSIKKTDVEAAIAKLTGTTLGGRPLTVEIARERAS
jgi:ATP-dependent RNA helicase DeaD